MEFSLIIDLISRIQECVSVAFALLFESLRLQGFACARSCGLGPVDLLRDLDLTVRVPSRTRAKAGACRLNFNFLKGYHMLVIRTRVPRVIQSTSRV